MSKYNRNRRVARVGKNKRMQRRVWYLNVGDGAKRTVKGENPNDGRMRERVSGK